MLDMKGYRLPKENSKFITIIHLCTQLTNVEWLSPVHHAPGLGVGEVTVEARMEFVSSSHCPHNWHQVTEPTKPSWRTLIRFLLCGLMTACGKGWGHFTVIPGHASLTIPNQQEPHIYTALQRPTLRSSFQLWSWAHPEDSESHNPLTGRKMTAEH